MSSAFTVVHLVAADTPSERLPTLMSLLNQPGAPPQAVVALGGGRIDLGAKPCVERLHSPWPVAAARRLTLGRYLRRRGFLEKPLILHAWSVTAASWGRLLAAGHRPVLVEAPPGEHTSRLARWAASGCVHLVCPSMTARAELLAAGAPSTHCVVIRPPVDGKRCSPDRRLVVRSRLNLTVRELAVLALPPLDRHTGAFVAAWGTMLLEKVRPEVRLVIPADGREAERVRRLVAACRHEWMARFAPRDLELWDLLVACDVAIYLPTRNAPPSALAWAAAARRPVVAAAMPSVTELFAAGETAWLCPPQDPQQAARRLLHALEHPAQSRRLAEQAAAVAELFRPELTLERYALIYQRLATRRPVAGG